MCAMRWLVGLAIASLPCVAHAASALLPPAVVRQLPPGHVVLARAQSNPQSEKVFLFVALADRNEPKGCCADKAPVRPLLVFEKIGDRYRQVARNDWIVLRANEGGQCDPFEGGKIVATGRYVTIENGVACGQHWTSFITFRFDRRVGGYVFDNDRFQSLKWNPDQRPGAEALVIDVDHVEGAKGRVIPLARWRRRN